MSVAPATIPERLVHYENGKATVRVPDKGGKPVERAVVPGLSDGLTVEVEPSESP